LAYLLKDTPQEFGSLKVYFTAVACITSPRGRILVSLSVPGCCLGNTLIEMPKFFFHLAQLVLHMQQDPVVQMLKLAIHRYNTFRGSVLSLGRLA
jgi:hypothetical protein